MALIALQSEALEQGSRNIELGETAYDALKRLGLPDGGKVAEMALGQIEKLARCHVSFRIGTELKGLEINERLVEAFEYDTDGKVFIKRVRLRSSLLRRPAPSPGGNRPLRRPANPQQPGRARHLPLALISASRS